MRRTTRFAVSAIALALSVSAAQAIWEVAARGAWPKEWPAELESLRDQSGTIQGGGLLELQIHRIPFVDREQFEQAWPHLLKVKTPGAPVILMRSPHAHWHYKKTVAGVLIHCPPGGLEPKVPAKPIEHVDTLEERWLKTTYIELVVDGKIVDLNRVALPADTPIIDMRFTEPQELKAQRGRAPARPARSATTPPASAERPSPAVGSESPPASPGR